MVRGWIGEASRKQTTGGGRGHGRLGWLCAWMDALDSTTGRLLEAERWVQRRAFRRERCSDGAGDERKRKAERNKAGKGIAHLQRWFMFMMSSRGSCLY